MQPIERKPDPQFVGFFGLLGIVSLLGVLYCVAVLADIQPIPLHLADSDLLLYAAWFLAASVSSVAILRWKKWGVYLLGVATLVVTLVNIVQGSATWGGASLGAIIAFVLVIYLRPLWDRFE